MKIKYKMKYINDENREDNIIIAETLEDALYEALKIAVFHLVMDEREKKFIDWWESENECHKSEEKKDIEWEELQFDSSSYQDATCKKCGCEFKEIHDYIQTEWMEVKTKIKYNDLTPGERIDWLIDFMAISVKEAMEIYVDNFDELPDEIKDYIII